LPAPTTNSGNSRLLAVVDPAHGGEERGSALTDTLAEKDVTLGFARILRHELEQRGFAVTLLRDADTNSTLDQRAAAANVAHAAVYICLHAVSQGSGARSTPRCFPSKAKQWNLSSLECGAVASFSTSRVVSAAIVAEMQNRNFPVHASSARCVR